MRVKPVCCMRRALGPGPPGGRRPTGSGGCGGAKPPHQGPGPQPLTPIGPGRDYCNAMLATPATDNVHMEQTFVLPDWNASRQIRQVSCCL